MNLTVADPRDLSSRPVVSVWLVVSIIFNIHTYIEMAMERGREGERERDIYIYLLFIYLLIDFHTRKRWLVEMTNLFPVRSKGSRFTLGVWGLRVCSFDVAFTFATVRNRLQPFARLLCGRTHGKFCRRGHFWMFQTSRCFVSRGRRGTS